jgi:hypothetical protein
MATVVIWPTGKTNDEITRKTENETRQVRTHTWAPDTSPKVKSLQDLSIRVNPEATEAVMHHAGLWIDGGLHLRLHVCKVIHSMFESSDPFHLDETRRRVFPNRWSGWWWEVLHLCGGTDGDVIAVRSHRNTIMCRIADRPPGLMWWWHEWWRPCGILWSITGAWARASAERARREHSLHSTYQFLHPAQHLQQQHITRST